MRTRLTFLAICSLLLSLLTTTTAANSLTANLEVIAVTDSKPGEVELTFFSRIASKSLSSYQITAKPKLGVGLTFTKRYTKKASGYITHKISPLSSEVDYIFTITATTNKNKLIKSAPYNYLVSSTVPSTPLITKVEATDADEAVVFFTAPKDDGGTPIYYYTATSNPGAISVIAPIQGSGSVTVTGLTKATTYTFTLTAHNINGSSRAATSPAPITTLAEKIVRVSPTSSSSNAPTLAAPAFTLSSSSQSVIVNTAITTVTNTSTGGAIASYAISPAAPAGLTFSTSTGQLSGTPTSTQSATNYTITATNAAGSATQTFALTVTYAVGNTGPGGGKIFYVATTPFVCGPTRATTCTYLEAAPPALGLASFDSDTVRTTARTWAQATPIKYDTATVGSIGGDTATATAIGWGYRNTRAIVAQGNTNTATSAAALADSHTVTVSGVVYDDWYLPSRDELNQMCKWQRGQAWTSDATACNNTGAINSGSGAAGFVGERYWSSSESDAPTAFSQLFTGASSFSNNKPNTYYVRPIRAF
jgi:hypothetical protein